MIMVSYKSYTGIDTSDTYPCCDPCADLCLRCYMLLVSDDERVKRLETYEEARTFSLVCDARPFKFKPTADERIGHLYGPIINLEIVTRRNFNIGVPRHLSCRRQSCPQGAQKTQGGGAKGDGRKDLKKSSKYKSGRHARDPMEGIEKIDRAPSFIISLEAGRQFPPIDSIIPDPVVETDYLTG